MTIKTWRLSIILVLVAASLLLAVPAIAGAHVKAKYRADYKSELALLNKGFMAFAATTTTSSRRRSMWRQTWPR